MIDFHTFSQIKALQGQGLSVCQCARELKLDRATVSLWFKRERYQRQSVRVQRTSKLDPYKSQITRWLDTHPFSANQIFQKLREQGYEGRYSIVCAYVRTVRPTHRQAYLQLRFAPGQCAQVDFGHAGYVQIGNTRRALSFFVLVLGHSRWMYVEFTLGQGQEWFLDAHQRAFQRLGAVPREIMVDNCKTAILYHTRGEAAVPNARYLDFARHYGFTIKACGPRHPQSKGIVENAVGYVKKNFLSGRTLTSLASINASCQRWLDEVANVRKHGETDRVPNEVLLEEKPSLLPLHLCEYDVSTTHLVRVNARCRVQVQANRYSVPARCVGKILTVHLSPERLFVFDGEQKVAEHKRCYERGRDFEDPAHTQALREQRHRARHQLQLEKFLQLGPAAQLYYNGLCERHPGWRGHIDRILALGQIHGPEPLLRALHDATELSAYSSHYIEHLLDQRRRQLPPAAPLHLTRASDMLDLDLPAPDLTLYDQ